MTPASRLIHSRDLLFTFLQRDLRIRYKRSVLGAAWSLMTPLLQLVVFTFVFKTVMNVPIARYSTYAFTGIVVWTFFQSAVAQGAHAITGNRELVRQPGFAVSLLPVSQTLVSLFHLLVALPLLGAALWISATPIELRSLAALPLLAMLFVLTLAIVYTVAALNVLFRDIQHITTALLQLLTFVTPVYWSTDLLPEKYHWIASYNPMAVMLAAFRSVLLGGAMPSAAVLVAMLTGSMLALLLARLWFVRMSHRFAEEI